MNRTPPYGLLLLGAGFAASALIVSGPHATTLAAQAATGTIIGHVRLMSPAPPNPIIRMGGDPRCSRALAGKRVTQDLVVRSADGGLANAFVNLQGSFPATPVPSEAVSIDQRNCIFVPRVIGARVGQTLQITNSDPTAHNVHSLSTKGNAFNTGQPLKGMVHKVQLKADEIVRITCDIHSWMVAYVGVTTHPYFAVSSTGGAFTIARVPAGRHTIQVWHEQYGRLTRMVDVKPGATTSVEFSYTGKEKPSAAGLQDLVVPGESVAVRLVAKL